MKSLRSQATRCPHLPPPGAVTPILLVPPPAWRLPGCCLTLAAPFRCWLSLLLAQWPLPSPLLPLSPSRPPPSLPPPSPRGGDRRACNLVPFARLEQHLPPSPGTEGLIPNHTRSQRQIGALMQMGWRQGEGQTCHTQLACRSLHTNRGKQIPLAVRTAKITATLIRFPEFLKKINN